MIYEKRPLKVYRAASTCTVDSWLLTNWNTKLSKSYQISSFSSNMAPWISTNKLLTLCT